MGGSLCLDKACHTNSLILRFWAKMNAILTFLVLSTTIFFCYSVNLNKEYQRYVVNVLEKFSKGLLQKTFQEIIPERPRIDEIPSPLYYTLPNLYIWDPLTQYEDIFCMKPLLCERHQKQLQQCDRWSDGSSNSRSPRNILGINGPALLIYREYYCNSGDSRHYIRSTDVDLLRIISRFLKIPFTMTHKSACTQAFMDRFRMLVSNGLSFNLIQALTMESQLEKCEHMRNDFKKQCELYKSIHGNSTELQSESYVDTVFEDYNKFVINLCPSDDYLCDLFLKDFGERKEFYQQSMRTITANSLMADHTFKVTINIGVHRNDNTWIKQFNSLFVVLNEEHKVVSWKLVKKEQFDLVKDVLENIRDRILLQGGNIKLFMIDNCCKWRKKIQEVFGENTKVSLDLFHAVQRITRTIAKQHPFHSSCVHNLSMVFRAPGDSDKIRRESTPDVNSLLTNIERFHAKWERISNNTQGILMRESFGEQINNLKEHILTGCLSGIPPGYSTSTNECMHEKINDIFAGAKMGPELAIALLTVFFYSWNSRKSNKIKGIPIVMPLRRETFETCFNHKNEGFGIGTISNNNLEDSSPIIKTKPIEITEQSAEQNTIINRAISMLSLSQNMKVKNKLHVSLFHLFFESEILKYLLKTTPLSMRKLNKSKESIASTYGMNVEMAPNNGDCLFHAIGTGVKNLFGQYRSGAIVDYFKELELFDKTPKVLAAHLRQLMANELVLNKEKYVCFLEDDKHSCYEQLVEAYRKPGVFSGDVGDLMVKALANILKVPIILVTSMSNFPVVTVTPESFVDKSNSFCIYLLFDRDGPGHYDCLIDKMKIQEDATKDKRSERCTCGASGKTTRLTCTNDTGTVTYGKRHYISRCPCLHGQGGCTESCRCKGCSNPYGKRPEQKQSTNPRKRKKCSFSGDRKSGIDFMIEQNEEIECGKWTEEENAILLQLLKENPEILNSEMKDTELKEFTHKYNKCITAGTNLGLKDLRKRNTIETKLKSIKKKKELFYLFMAEQIESHIKELS